MISIIIPTLNEESDLPDTLDSISNQEQAVAREVIVADGGSSDQTIALAESAGCHVVRCEKSGRATQMNSGAAVAKGDIFLFLHADTHLTPGGLSALSEAMENPKLAGGGFVRRFRSPSIVLQITSRIGALRSRLFSLYFGDQAIFSRRHAFESLGGFPDLPTFEDFDFSRRLRGVGKTRSLKPVVYSSARRFHARGAFSVSALDTWLIIRFLLGGDPHKLAARNSGKRGDAAAE